MCFITGGGRGSRRLDEEGLATLMMSLLLLLGSGQADVSQMVRSQEVNTPFMDYLESHSAPQWQGIDLSVSVRLSLSK